MILWVTFMSWFLFSLQAKAILSQCQAWHRGVGLSSAPRWGSTQPSAGRSEPSGTRCLLRLLERKCAKGLALSAYRVIAFFLCVCYLLLPVHEEPRARVRWGEKGLLRHYFGFA